MIKEAYYFEEDARARAMALCFEQGGYIERAFANCDKLPCPKELDNWSGETEAYAAYNAQDEQIAIIGYWE